ncbi:MAG: protein adenylyltransferase SelO family protein, partial [Bermanella sp.]
MQKTSAMNTLPELNYVQPFLTLPKPLYSQVMPQGLSNPRLVIGSASTAGLLGLDVNTLEQADSLQLISGQGVLNTWQPIAMKYTGHQFGQYNPQLGDGRGL